jgi:hypothetical protein
MVCTIFSSFLICIGYCIFQCLNLWAKHYDTVTWKGKAIQSSTQWRSSFLKVCFKHILSEMGDSLADSSPPKIKSLIAMKNPDLLDSYVKDGWKLWDFCDLLIPAMASLLCRVFIYFYLISLAINVKIWTFDKGSINPVNIDTNFYQGNETLVLFYDEEDFHYDLLLSVGLVNK